MELQEFIQKAISDITAAVDTANTSSTRRITFKTHEGKRTVEFDIAVTAESTSNGTAGAGIKVLSLIDIGGTTTNEIRNSIISRVSVGIDIDEYTNAEKEAHELAMREFERSQRDSYVNPAM